MGVWRATFIAIANVDCHLPPPIMKTAQWAIRESPLREVIFRGITHAGLPSAHRGMKARHWLSADFTRLPTVAEDGFPPRIGVRGDVPSRE